MRNFIPKEFRFAHGFAYYLHDLLAQVVVEGERARLFDHTIKFRKKDTLQRFAQLSPSEDVWKWMSRNRRLDHYTLIYKQIFVAVLSDYCHFIYEALSCSRKGKLTVAYSLLRKPLKDNLFILEWLLGDPADFIDRFYNDRADSFDPTKLSKERKTEIIDAAIKETGEEGIDSELIYDLRYDRAHPHGFAGICDQAAHLVTTFNQIKTDSQNINFVFSGNDSRYSQWNHFYGWLPFLLNYSVHVVEAILRTFTERDEISKRALRTQTTAGMLLWGSDFGIEVRDDVFPRRVRTECNECGAILEYTRQRMLRRLYYHGNLLCSSCSAEIYLDI